ncbi:MAG TPA: hypothetical protein ENN80_10265 [Candidatus Hydrogenedentes bacterium]|nr:hypothetical protein [Candidatus Hydrogenedentota bacterium]
MIIVNLLPEELRPVKRTPVPYLLSVLIFAGAMGLMASLWLSALQEEAMQRSELKKYQDRLGEYGDIVEQYNTLEEDKVRLAERIGTIEEIVADRIIWSRQLWNLSRLTPSNIWLKSMAVRERSFTVTRTEYDEKRKTHREVRESVKVPVLDIAGYVVPDDTGSMQFFPLTVATERDSEFSRMFKLESQKREVTEFNGRPVLFFELTYRITQGKESG